jgi:two-component system, NtrC family, sensor kinase
MPIPNLAQFEAAPLVPAEAAAGQGSTGRVGALSLRAKGMLVFAALVVYVACVAFLMARQWHQSLVVTAQMQELESQQSRIERLYVAAGHAVVTLQDVSRAPSLAEMAADVNLLVQESAKLAGAYPALAQARGRLGGDILELHAAAAPGAWSALRDTLSEVGAQARAIASRLNERRQALSRRSRALHESIAITGLAAGLLGVIALGATMALFLARLGRDIRELESHAVDIVNGYRGAPLKVRRRDEVGTLMKAVNRMQSELRHREQQSEISREQRFHQEKMAAMGSLAAAVAHEINNPIAAITGIAQQMDDARCKAGCPEASCRPELILENTRRIASISRQLSEMTAPHSQEPELLDINGLVRSTANFIVYDKRFRGIDVALDLDPAVPALRAVSDHVTQVLMNLLINSADALQDVKGRTPAIRVTTRAANGEVLITVRDNGHGMDRSLLSKVFEESFTTKPPDRGRGLGLFLSKTLIEQGGGRIELESEPGTGTTACIRMPVPPQARS